MEKKYQIDALDGLRGMALVFVLLSHLSGIQLHIFGQLSMAGMGKFGVYLFFVLSSFLLSIPLLEKSTAQINNSKLWFNYCVRRFFRIYPLFICVLLISYFSTLVLGPYFDGKGLPFTLFWSDVMNHLMLMDGKEVLWSIPVEFKFYFLLPFLLYCYVVVLKNNVIYCALFSLFIFMASIIIWPESSIRVNDIRLGPYLPLFICGSFSALIHIKMCEVENFSNTHKRMFEIISFSSLVLIICFVPEIFQNITGANIPLGFFTNKIYIFAILWSFILLGTIHGAGLMKRLFSNKLLRLVGFISYSAYLLHIGVIKVINNLFYFNPMLKSWLIVLLVMLVSYFSYKIIEKPFSKIRVKY